MMVNTFVWPWKNDDELLEVRQLFYPDPKLPDDARRERQQLGVNIVNTWRLRRCRIPHSIQATADLVDADLHRNTPNNSSSTTRTLYASALAKMVTSVCDLEQDSLEKRSMMEQAKRIGMPEDWVHLRHSITHGQTPGLKPLQEAVREAVPWMWDHFWKHLDVDDEMPEDNFRSEIINILTDYRHQRRTAITMKQEASFDTNLASQISKTLCRSFKKSARGLDIFIDVLLHENVALPSQKQSNLKFKALLLIWNDLLVKISEREPKFQEKFAFALVQMLGSSSTNLGNSAGILEIASKWLCYVLLDPAWTSIISPDALEALRCDIVEACLLNKNDFTSLAMKDVLSAMSGYQAEAFNELIKLCDEEDQSENMGMGVEAIDDQGDVPGSARGWSRPVTVWLPRPVGVWF